MIPIILIEDEFLVRMGLKTCISWETEGYEIVAEASDGESALLLYEKYKPKLVITDISLPGKSGIEVLREIRAQDEDVKFLIVTAYDEFELAREAISIGVEGYFVKGSLNTEEIIECLRNLKEKYKEELLETLDTEEKPDSLLDIYHRSSMSPEPENYLQMQIARKELRMLVFQMKNTDLERFSQLLHSFFNQRKISHQFGKEPHYVWFFVEQSGDELKELSRNMIQMLERYMNSSVKIGVSQNFYLHKEMKNTIYEAILAANSLKHKDGICVEFYGKDDRPYEGIRGWSRKLEDLLKEKQYQEAENTLEQIFSILERGYSVSMLRKMLYKVVGCLLDYDSEFRESIYYNELLKTLDIDAICDKLLLYVRDISQTRRGQREESLYISRAKTYVREHYQEQLNIRRVAESIHVSPSYLGRLFFQETGEYLTDFIHKLKMDKAKELLEAHSYSMNEIAEKVGIVDQHYFSRLFKKYCGVAPREYQKRTED